MRLLGLVALLVACSSESGTLGGDQVEGGGAAGETGSANSGGSSAKPTAGAAPKGGGAQAGEPGGGASPTDSAGQGGETAAGGAPVGVAGEGGAVSAVGMAGDGGAPVIAGSGGSPLSEDGAAGAGDGGAPVDLPDPCAGTVHWDKSERWAENIAGALRHFAGSLWECRSADYCRFYPGNGEPKGWVAVAECSSGPIKETECQCAAGACCDGCYVRPASYFCGEFVRTAQCLGPAVNQCGGAQDTIDKDWWNLFCDGTASATCSRWGAHTKYSNGDCPAKTGCVESGDQASCQACSG